MGRSRGQADPAAPAVLKDVPGTVGRDDLGFLLAKATQRWNELLAERFAAAGYSDVRPSYGSVLLPLFEEDGLRMGQLARRARLSKQTMTEMVRRLERDRLVERRADPSDGRASLIFLTARSRSFEPIAAGILGELDRLVRQRLDDERVDELKTALRELLNLGADS
jgi:DNA-binding MarR family transcriptional regulator